MLIEILASPASDPEVKRLCVQWLEGITRRAFGHDTKAWQRFWKRNGNRSFDEWLIGAAAQDSPLLRASALGALGHRAPSDEGKRVLLDNLRHTHAPVRLAASASLLRWGDRRGVAPLLDMLESTLSTPRQQAFQALALVGETTLGYDPTGTEEQRAGAVARWRRWAEENASADLSGSD